MAKVAIRSLTSQRSLSNLPVKKRIVRFLAFGDSKTYGQGDDLVPSVYPAGSGGYPPRLKTKLNANPNQAWEHFLIGKSGWDVTMFMDTYLQDIALLTNRPHFILANLGTNDSARLTAAAHTTWVANYGTILDAFHSAFPEAKVFVARPWHGTQASMISIIDDQWIPEILSTRSSWCFAGPDERNLLAPNPPGLAPDLIHPNAAGYDVMADAWYKLI